MQRQRVHKREHDRTDGQDNCSSLERRYGTGAVDQSRSGQGCEGHEQADQRRQPTDGRHTVAVGRF